MKLTFITEAYPPDAGGIATSSQRLATSLARAGHRLQVLTFDRSRPLEHSDCLQRERLDDFEVIRLGPFFGGHPLIQKLPPEAERAMFRRRVCDQMVREAAAFAPDAILGLCVVNAGFLARFVAAELAVPFFVSVRGMDVGLGIFDLQQFAAVRWTLESATAVICVNHYLRKRSVLVVPEIAPRTFVVLNAVGIPELEDRSDAMRRLRAATRWDDAAFVVVFIGILREKKGVVPLLEAMAMLADTSVRLLVVGAALERRFYRPAWDDLVRAGQVWSTGQVERDEVAHWAAAGHAVIMPSLEDGLANGLLEGMALGLCPVGSFLFQDVIRDGENGFLVDAHSPDHIAAVLRRLADDRALAARAGAAAREYVARHHAPEREAREYAGIITPRLSLSASSK